MCQPNLKMFSKDFFEPAFAPIYGNGFYYLTPAQYEESRRREEVKRRRAAIEKANRDNRIRQEQDYRNQVAKEYERQHNLRHNMEHEIYSESGNDGQYYHIVQGPDGRLYHVPVIHHNDDVGLPRSPLRDHGNNEQTDTSLHSKNNKNSIDKKEKTEDEPLLDQSIHSVSTEKSNNNSANRNKHRNHGRSHVIKTRKNNDVKVNNIIVEDASDSEHEGDELKSIWRNRRPTPGQWMEPVQKID